MVPRKRVMEYGGAERRRHGRCPFWAMVGVSDLSGNEFQASSGLPSQGFASCVNISEGGMLLESYDRFAEGTVLAMELSLQDLGIQKGMRFVGRVVRGARVDRSSMNGLGVSFLRTPPEFMRLIERAPQGHPDPE